MQLNGNKHLLIEAQYWGSIAYFSLLKKHGYALIEQHEHYVKSSYRNRCHIATPNGQLVLSVPLVSGRNQRRTMHQVGIYNQERWQKLHWDSLCYAYRRSPYFEFYEDDLEPFFKTPYDNLLAYNLTTTRFILDLLQLEVKLELTTEYIDPNNENYLDYRSAISPKKGLQKGIKTCSEYHQVFNDKHGFLPNLSILDLLFNEGPNAVSFL